MCQEFKGTKSFPQDGHDRTRLRGEPGAADFSFQLVLADGGSSSCPISGAMCSSLVLVVLRRLRAWHLVILVRCHVAMVAVAVVDRRRWRGSQASSGSCDVFGEHWARGHVVPGMGSVSLFVFLSKVAILDGVQGISPNQSSNRNLDGGGSRVETAEFVKSRHSCI